MSFFYYQENGQYRQIEADSFTQVGTPVVGNFLGAGRYTFTGLGLCTNQSLSTTQDIKGADNLGLFPFNCQTSGTSPNTHPYQVVRLYLCSGAEVTVGTLFGQSYKGSLNISRLADACSSGCITTFYQGSTVIQTLSFCPTIDEDIRNPDCSQCCSELLPMLRAISV